MGIREVEIARHAETLLDYFIGFINEAVLTEKDLSPYTIGLSIGRQVGEFLLCQLHEGNPFMMVNDAVKKQGDAKIEAYLDRGWKNLWEIFTSSMKSVFSGGSIEYEIDQSERDHVTFKVIDNPFCRTLMEEKKQKCCEILSGVIAGAAMSMRADNTLFLCVESECNAQSKKGCCTFDLCPSTDKSKPKNGNKKKK